MTIEHTVQATYITCTRWRQVHVDHQPYPRPFMQLHWRLQAWV